jgi:hypothetical protein
MSQSDFKIVAVGVFPVYLATQVILHLQGFKMYKKSLHSLPEEY